VYTAQQVPKRLKAIIGVYTAQQVANFQDLTLNFTLNKKNGWFSVLEIPGFSWQKNDLLILFQV